MEILKRFKLSLNVTCRHCQSELQAGEEDVVARPVAGGHLFWVTCPVCGAKPQVEPWTLPPYTQHRIIDRSTT